MDVLRTPVTHAGSMSIIAAVFKNFKVITDALAPRPPPPENAEKQFHPDQLTCP